MWDFYALVLDLTIKLLEHPYFFLVGRRIIAPTSKFIPYGESATVTNGGFDEFFI